MNTNVQVEGKPVVSVSQIATMFGVTTGAVNNWLGSPKFPTPVGKIGRTRLFFASDVEAFVAARRARKSAINSLRSKLNELSDVEFDKVVSLLGHKASARPKKVGKSTAK